MKDPWKGVQVSVVALSVLVSAGCTTVVRENVLPSVDTGIGASVAENKQTQMYELKVGYIRSQFYSIPTGKTVEQDKNGPDQKMLSNEADKTPQVVSGIKMHSGLQDLLLGLDVSENFAVGSTAVMSPAAVAMYVSQATSPGAAQAASAAASNVSAAPDPQLPQEQATLDGLLKETLITTPTPCAGTPSSTTLALAQCLANQIEPGATVTSIRFHGGTPLQNLIAQLTPLVH